MPVETRHCEAGESKAEPEFFAGKDTLVAYRTCEAAKTAADWLRFHRSIQNTEAALIVDTTPGDGFGVELAELMPEMPVLVVTSDTSIERLYDDLRQRFLKDAGAVAFLNITDVAVSKNGQTIFDHIRASPVQISVFEGCDCYPWGLRQSEVAQHRDHTLVPRKGAQRLTTWGAVAGGLPKDAIWTPTGVKNPPSRSVAGRQFYRAVGIADSAAVQTDLQASELVEVPTLLAAMKTAFDAKPRRLPAPKVLQPRPVKPTVAVVSVMKNEGPFILDWIAHNRALGIDRHLVYTNDCADGTDHLLDALAEAGVVRRDNPYQMTGKVPQHAAFKDAEEEPVVQGADWLVALDVDEYINIHVGDGHLSHLLGAVPDAHLISMRWRLFGNAHRHAFEDRPVTEAFTRAAPDLAPQPLQAWAFKTLYRNAGLFRRIGVHRPKGLNTAMTDMLWVNGAGRDIPKNTWRTCWRDTTEVGGYDLVTLNHYAVRSAESFLVKRARGRANHTENDLGAKYWFRMNHNAVEDRSIQRRAKASAEEKARLLTLPGVAEAHAAAVDWHQARIKALRAEPEGAAFYAQITSPRMEKLSRMATKFGPNVHYFGPDLVPDEVADRDPKADFYFNGTPEVQAKIRELCDARPDPDLFRAR